jgi:ATP-dependent DNA helicase PIF1
MEDIKDAEVNMNELQRKVVDLAKKNKNIFITGSAGTGKSYVVKYLHKYFEDSALCSTTGIGATIIGGQTLHSLLYLGLGTSTKMWYMSNSMTMNALRKLEIIILDEVSMLSDSLFKTLNELAKVAKKNDKPFGGIQLIFSGDFLQLPPVQAGFIFKTATWKECDFEVVELREIIRQSDVVFASHLQKIRIGVVTEEAKLFFDARKIDDDTNTEAKNSPFKPTILLSHVRSVDKYNDMMLQQLKHKKKYEFVRTVKKTDNTVTVPIHVPEKISLMQDAQVILTANLDIAGGLVNGSRGFITGFTSEGLPIVNFVNGVTQVIDRHTWKYKKNNRVICSYTQIPLLFGWAITIHKSQGMSLDLVAIDISKCFDDGQAYVALSRARTIEGLFLLNVDWTRIRANRDALNFYSKISEM